MGWDGKARKRNRTENVRGERGGVGVGVVTWMGHEIVFWGGVGWDGMGGLGWSCIIYSFVYLLAGLREWVARWVR